MIMAEEMSSSEIKRYKPAFKDTRDNRVIVSGVIHLLDVLTPEQVAIVEIEEGENIDNERRTIIDGFVDKITGEFLSRGELEVRFRTEESLKVI